MQVFSAYILVVFIWSTTPLAIHFSNSSLPFVAAASLRMLFALVVCYLLLRAMGQRLVQQRRDLLIFAVSATGLFPNMLIVYWAAQYVPSGLMSVVMGMYPFCVGVMSWLLLRENVFTPSRVAALVIAVAGLITLHYQQMQIDPNTVYGLLGLLFMCASWATSTVWLKKVGQDMAPLRLGTGSLMFAVPCFLAAWWWFEGGFRVVWDVRSAWGVGYLVLAGSVVGHTLYFYILKHCAVGTVSLVTLITPALAITWGILFAGEQMHGGTWLGASLILLSLGLYLGVLQRLALAFGPALKVLATSYRAVRFRCHRLAIRAVVRFYQWRGI